MDIPIILTDRQKKALRYLGMTQDNFKDLILADANARVIALVDDAKRRYLATKTMDDIDPTPI